MQIRFACLLIFLAGAAQAQADGLYPAAAIPEAMRRNAYAVIRLHETTFTVKSAGEAVEKVHYVVTVLNERGKGQAKMNVFYDKLHRVENVQGALYDEFGRQVSRLKKADIQDVGLEDAGTFVGDNRAKMAEFMRIQYPYTVEFEYEVTTHNLIFYPVWQPQDDDEVSIEKASFKVLMPAGMDLRYKELNVPAKAAVTTVATGKQYEWNVSNLPTFQWEKQSLSSNVQVPVVYTAPTDFEVQGYKGNMRTWADAGKFYYTLNHNRDGLSEEMKQKIRQVVAGETDVTKKTKRIYEYLQANTRYVGIQLGIGGWQTFTALEVTDKGYGDCKALSNYTKAMLKTVGIESYCTLVNAGKDESEVMTDFPNLYFNHVIVCVPTPKDTIWLECTDQNGAFGYQGTFTGNRHALVTTPTGGKLVKTTRYQASDNLQNRRIDIAVDENGDAKAAIRTVYTGEQQEEINGIMHYLGVEDQKKALYRRIDIPSFEIDRFSLSAKKDRIPSVTETLSLTVRKCASKSGTRLFVTPNLMNAISQVPSKAENRKTEFVLRSGYQNADTVVYQLPKGYGVEFLPDDVRMESKFGTYAASLQSSDGQVVYTRHVTVNRGRHPAAAYNEWVEFSRKIAKADKAQMVLVNKGL